MKRIFCMAVMFAVTVFGTLSGTPARADEDTKVIKAQGNPYLTDFMSVKEKRANLRVAMVRKGLDAAFSEWLKREHPFVYRECAQKETAR